MTTDQSRSFETPDNWNAASRGYGDKVAPVLMRPFADDVLQRLAIGTEATVLEVGAGTGALTESLYRSAGSVVAVDYAPQMIEVLEESRESWGATNVECRVMDGQDLAFDDSSFDAAASMFALMLFADRQKGFSELNRVVRPGGSVVVAGWSGPDKFEAFALFLQAVQEAFPEMPAPASPPPVFSLSDPKTFQAEMESAGFQDVQVDSVSRTLEVPDFESLWSMLTVGAPPVQALFEKIGETGKGRLRERLKEIVEQRFGSQPIRLTNVATLGHGLAT